MIGIGSSGIKIDGHIGKWYVIDREVIDYKAVFLLEHETYGDEAPCLIVDEDLNVLLDEVWNGFDDYRYYLSSKKGWELGHEAIDVVSQTAMYLHAIGNDDMANKLLAALETLKGEGKSNGQ